MIMGVRFASMNTDRNLSSPLLDLKTGNFVRLQDHAIQIAEEGESSRAFLPATPLEMLGDPTFCRDHKIRFPFVSGAMANGIASEALVAEMVRGGMLGFFGAAGLSIDRIEDAINRLSDCRGPGNYGFNFIHSPNEPSLEDRVIDLYLRRGVHLIEAAAFMTLTLPVLRFRLAGIYRDDSGNIVTPNRIIAKISRVEVAQKFMSPAPREMLDQLVASGCLTAMQAQLAQEVPVAQDITAEADSGGHTDNRPTFALMPAVMALRNRLQEKFQYKQALRVGAAGGISTPASASAAFALGSAFIVTGSVNQACIESGSSDLVRSMLASAEQADFAMAASADMFEMGVKVQVLKRGTMFPMRANKLYELFHRFKDIDELPPAERQTLEKNIFKKPLTEVWQETYAYFQTRDPNQIVRAEKDPHHKMALIFRWYLGQSSIWANRGVPDRKIDFQIWCGPAMGAFNEWVQGSFLQAENERKILTVSLNILYGAAIMGRLNILRQQGLAIPPEKLGWSPRREDELWTLIGGKLDGE
jgi:PfaD family protein